VISPVLLFFRAFDWTKIVQDDVINIYASGKFSRRARFYTLTG